MRSRSSASRRARTSTSARAAACRSHPRTLVYGKFGYSNGDVDLELDDLEDIIEDFDDSGSRDGWHFGAGVEQNFGPMFYGKLEYVYTIYSDLDFASPDAALVIDGNRSQIMAGLGLRF